MWATSVISQVNKLINICLLGWFCCKKKYIQLFYYCHEDIFCIPFLHLSHSTLYQHVHFLKIMQICNSLPIHHHQVTSNPLITDQHMCTLFPPLSCIADPAAIIRNDVTSGGSSELLSSVAFIVCHFLCTFTSLQEATVIFIKWRYKRFWWGTVTITLKYDECKLFISVQGSRFDAHRQLWVTRLVSVWQCVYD